jgi:hypothetical protein
MRKDSKPHIPAKRMIRFANGEIELTAIEAKHFDGCGECNTALRDAIRGSTKGSRLVYLAHFQGKTHPRD